MVGRLAQDVGLIQTSLHQARDFFYPGSILHARVKLVGSGFLIKKACKQVEGLVAHFSIFLFQLPITNCHSSRRQRQGGRFFCGGGPDRLAGIFRGRILCKCRRR